MAESPQQRSYASVALFLMVVAEIPNFYSGFLPSLFTIATFSKGDQDKIEHTRKWIRRGETQATGLSIIVGAATAMLVAEAWPFIGALAMSGYLIWQYEHALRLGQRGGLGIDMDKQQ